MPNYAKNAASALRAITKAGQAAVLRRSTPGARNTETQTLGAPTLTNNSCFVVLFDFELTDSGSSQGSGTLIQAGDKQILLPASGLTLTPAPGDVVIVGGVTWAVKNVKEVNPAGIPILYELHGRR